MTTIIRLGADKDSSPGLISVTQRGLRLATGEEIWAQEETSNSVGLAEIGTVYLDDERRGMGAYTVNGASSLIRDRARTIGAVPPEVPLTRIERTISVVIGETRLTETSRS
jgi:hypothetical protein